MRTFSRFSLSSSESACRAASAEAALPRLIGRRTLGRGIAAALWLAVPLLTAFSPLTPPAAAAEGAGPAVMYEGRLQDGKRKPVGGIYPLTFSLHSRARGGKATWSESHFVAVDHGTYTVELGTRRALPADAKLDEMYLGVSLTGGDEILRERLDPKAVRPGATTATAQAQAPPVAAGSDGRRVVDYAETAGLAYEAEHAKVADRVGELGEEELREALRQASEAGGKTSLGAARRYTASAGGEGGVQYELVCPKGHVVTGVRGGSGIYLDSIQLVCSPLE